MGFKWESIGGHYTTFITPQTNKINLTALFCTHSCSVPTRLSGRTPLIMKNEKYPPIMKNEKYPPISAKKVNYPPIFSPFLTIF